MKGEKLNEFNTVCRMGKKSEENGVGFNGFFTKNCDCEILSTMTKILATLLRTHGKAPGKLISFAVGTIVVLKLYAIFLGRLQIAEPL